MPLHIQLDRESPLGPAEQVKAQLRSAIRRGELRPGASLPRVRALAAELELNANTVATAYRDLAREELVVQRGKAGTRVAPGPFLPAAGDDELNAAVDRLVASARRWRRSHAEVLRLLAGRWFAPEEKLRPSLNGRRTIYELLAMHDHDQS